MRNFKFHIDCRGDKDKQPLLFLHGLLGSTHDFDEIVDACKNDFYCVAIDLPGHGETREIEDADYSAETIVREIFTELRAISSEKWALVGYSMGGRLALLMSLRFGPMFCGALIESANPGLSDEIIADRVALEESWQQKLKTMPMSDFLQQWYEQPLFSRFRELAHFEQTLQRRKNQRPDALIKMWRGMSITKQPDLWPELALSQVPMLFLSGDADERYAFIARRAAQMAAGARLALAPSCGHVVHAEAPEFFVKNIKNFFKVGV